MNLTYFIWVIVFIMLFITSFYFNIKFNFPQLNILRIIKSLRIKNKNDLSVIFTNIGGKVGVGNVIAISLAIHKSGEGCIFWIWIISIFSSIILFLETYYGIKYKDINNTSSPSYYIKYGLKNNKLSIVYSILIIITYSIGFSAIQSNTISTYLNTNKIIIGIIISLLTFLIINKGINGIIKSCGIIVPFMILLYIFIALYICIKNINLIPSIFNNIISKAFNFKSFIYGFLPIIITSTQRSIFSNEIGIGTSTFTSSLIKKYYLDISYIQIASIYLSSIILSTLTSIIILTSNYNIMNLEIKNGIELANYAFTYHLGQNGSIILFVIICLFAFSTILTCYLYGQTALIFMNKNSLIPLLKLIVTIIIFISCVINSSALWDFVDLLIPFMCIINLYSLIKLHKKIRY